MSLPRRDPMPERERGAPWVIVFLITMAAMLVGYGLSGGHERATPSQSSSQLPPIYETVAVVQLTWMAPTPTRTVSPTRTPTVEGTTTATPTNTPQPDYCSQVENETPCALPPAPAWTSTPFPICWVEITPKPGLPTICRKVDESGTEREESTE